MIKYFLFVVLGLAMLGPAASSSAQAFLSFNPPAPTIPCSAPPNTSVSQAMVIGGGNGPFAFSMSGDTTNFIINPSTGVISVGALGITSPPAACDGRTTNVMVGETITATFVATCPNQTSAISLVPGGLPVHVTVRNATTCAVDPPGSVSWTLSGPAASSITITPDATGFNFTAAMGSSGNATAATMGTTLAISISPAPASVPPGAQAAGFTTLALNTDWSAGTMPANWLGGCANAGDGTPWNQHDDNGHTWYLNLWWMFNYNSCVVVQVTDPVYGGLTLDCPWVVDNSNLNFGRGCGLDTVSGDYNALGVGEAHDFPNNMYVEVLMRQTPNEASSFGTLATWPSAAVASQSNAGLEGDIIEIDVGHNDNGCCSDAAWHDWHKGNPPPGQFIWGPGLSNNGLPSGFDGTQYHTYGLRYMTDGTTMWFCSYIDNVFHNCSQHNAFDPIWTPTQRYVVLIQNFCDSWNYGNMCVPSRVGEVQHQYIRWVRVWSCASWATQQCLMTPLTGPP